VNTPQHQLLVATLTKVAARTLPPVQPGSAPDWLSFLDGLRLHALRHLDYDLRTWLRWADSCQPPPVLGTAASVRDFFDHMEREGYSGAAMCQRAGGIKRFLHGLGWPDPDAHDVLLQTERGYGSRKVRYKATGSRPAFGWAQLHKLVHVADPDKRADVRDVALALVIYDGMARADEVLGKFAQKTWHCLPPTRADLRLRADGSARLHLGGPARRQVYLSPLTVHWIRRLHAFSPAGDTTLFPSLRGPLQSEVWTDSIKRLVARARLQGTQCNITSLRTGAVRDLVASGASLEDARSAGGLVQLATVLRMTEGAHHAEPMRHLARVQRRDRLPARSRAPCPGPVTADMFAAA
jgi:integrase